MKAVFNTSKCLIVSLIILFIIVLGITFTAFGFQKGAMSKTKYVYCDFDTEEKTVEEVPHKYSFLPVELSAYICDLSEQVGVDSDIVVAILMRENPEFNPQAMHKNPNGTIDLGMFQLNSKYVYTTFADRYWSIQNVEIDPFNWKHNTYIAVLHIAYLVESFKILDEAIMAYNCGEGAVMSNRIPDITRSYLAGVNNNLRLLAEQKCLEQS